MKEIDKLNYRPFTRFCMSIGAVPTSYLAGLTIEEQLLWLCSYLEKEVIPAVNNNGEAVEELQNLYIELKNYVDNYFENLDVQEEINNKLDVMAEDGTLDRIINQEIFGELNERIETLEDMVSNTPDLLFGVSFKASGMSAPTEMDYIISLDGINFSNIKIPNNFALRDPSITYDSTRKKFYLSGTPATQSEYTFIIYESEDLITWTPHEVAITGYLTELKWAPDLYYDATNDKLIVSFSYKYGTEVDFNGDTIDAFDIIFAETNDFTNFTMTNIRTANLINAPHRSHIDSNIIFKDNIWYLVVNEQYSRTLEVYQSTNLTDFTMLCQNVLNVNDKNDNTIFLEGACQYFFNNEYHIIADSYAHLHTLINAKSSNYQNFELACTNLNYFRHGDIISISDIDVKKIISSLPNYHLSTSDKLTPTPEYQTAIYIKRNQNREMTAIPNSIMFIEGTATITNLRNPFNCNEQKFEFITNTNEILNFTKIEDITKNKQMINTTYNNEKTISLNLNKNSNVFGKDTFEEIEVFNKATVLSKITDINENIEITDAVAYRAGNVLSVYLDIKLLTQIDTYIAPILKFNAIDFQPRAKTQWTNSTMTNMAMYNTGSMAGILRGNANTQISCSATYISK